MNLTEPYSRYLRLLGFSSPPSGLDGLRALVREHLFRVPFENVSKILLIKREGRGRVTSLTEFMDGIEYHDLGGTCYTNNPHLFELLRVLGYDADLLAADMTNPNVHTCIRVRLDSAEYHIDVGFGAPFSEPVALSRLPHEIRSGAVRYVLDRNAAPGEYEMAVWRESERIHRYVVHGPPRDCEYFRQTVEASYLPGTTFMTWLRIGRFFEDHSVDLIDRKIKIHRGGQTREIQLKSMKEMRAAVDNELCMPRCPVEEAVEVMERMNARKFFG